MNVGHLLINYYLEAEHWNNIYDWIINYVIRSKKMC